MRTFNYDRVEQHFFYCRFCRGLFYVTLVIVEIISTDIAIIGGGAAGLRAAIAAAEKYPQLKIALISKVYPVRSHTVSAEGGIAGVLRDYDSFEQHCFDTIRGSDFLADQDAVEFFVNEAPREIIQMEHWGCPWSREENGKIAVRAFGGMSVKRTVFAADKTGFYMLHTLFERSLKHENIKRYDEWFVTNLIRDESRVTTGGTGAGRNGGISGLVALDLRRGTLAAFAAKAIILAMGGAGKIYSFTTNGNIKTGDGMALAYRAGASLKDMEFVQFHPTGLPRTGILITEGARGEGGYLLNNKGERFMKNYLPNKMELGPRDIISRCIMSEIKAGRGFSGPYGQYVQLDIRHLGEKIIDEKLPLVREVAKDFGGVDPVYEPIPVMPVCHYFMGGVDTDKETRTQLPGLFAAGETACVSINGANRLGSNSLAECLVFGKVAGENAASHAAEIDAYRLSHTALKDEEKRITDLFKREGHYRVAPLREQLQKTMQESAGIERDGARLEKGLTTILDLHDQWKKISLQDKNRLFNTELTALLELENMLTVAQATLRAAVERTESRGSHSRSDFTQRNDTQFLKHILLKSGPSGMIVEEKPVTITQWQPQARVY